MENHDPDHCQGVCTVDKPGTRLSCMAVDHLFVMRKAWSMQDEWQQVTLPKNSVSCLLLPLIKCQLALEVKPTCRMS